MNKEIDGDSDHDVKAPKLPGEGSLGLLSNKNRKKKENLENNCKTKIILLK